MRQDLSTVLAESLRAGDTAAALSGALNTAIGDTPGTTHRRLVLAVTADALVMHANRCALDALRRGRLRTFVRLARLEKVLTGFKRDLVYSNPDRGADMIRVSLLRLHLSAMSAECPALGEAGAAMARVAATGAA
jgi:hypothetical protein